MKHTHALGIALVALAMACSSSSGGGKNDGGVGGSGGTGGSGGSGGTGGSGIDCNESCGYLTTCCPGLSLQDCLTGCTQNPSTDPNCTSCFDNTSCGALDTCVIANCGLPQDVCYGTAQ